MGKAERKNFTALILCFFCRLLCNDSSRYTLKHIHLLHAGIAQYSYDWLQKNKLGVQMWGKKISINILKLLPLRWGQGCKEMQWHKKEII